jgi:xanthine/uracil permease
VLYGMIGLLGAKIWKENRVDFGNPLNLVPVAAGIIIAIGDTSLKFSDTFSLSGIALGTIVVIAGYHLAHALAPQHMREKADAERVDQTLNIVSGGDDYYEQEQDDGQRG